MDLFNRKGLTVRRTPQTAIWTFSDDGGWVAEVFVRTIGGFHFHPHRYQGASPAPMTLYYEAYRQGILSPRPYHLQGIADPSVFYCVLALTVSCCRAWNLDPIAAFKAADPEACVSEDDLLELKDHARWEQAVFPGTWDTVTIQALSQALDDVQCFTLSAFILERTLGARGY